MRLKFSCLPLAFAGLLLLQGCATDPGYDYSAFVRARPASILILPPVNQTSQLDAGPAVMALATEPLAESGYYVFPVSLVRDTLKANGVTEALQAQSVSPAWLRQTFGADAALYMTIQRYGDERLEVDHEIQVQITARLVDLTSGTAIWEGTRLASSRDRGSDTDMRLGALVTPAVNQLLNEPADGSYRIAMAAVDSLLQAGKKGGMLYGPRSPNYALPDMPSNKSP